MVCDSRSTMDWGFLAILINYSRLHGCLQRWLGGSFFISVCNQTDSWAVLRLFLTSPIWNTYPEVDLRSSRSPPQSAILIGACGDHTSEFQQCFVGFAQNLATLSAADRLPTADWLLCLIYKSVLIFCFNQLCTCNLAYRIASKCSQCTTIQTFPVVWKCKAPMSFWRDRDFSHSLLGLEEQSGTSLPYRYRDLQWLAEFQHSIEAFLQSAHQIRLLHPSGWAIYTSSCSSPFKKHLFVQIATTVLWDSNRTTGENISS